jgi:multidrug resistance protein
MYSELLGRRTIYITSFAFFVIFAAISAVSTNIAMLIVFRILAGGAAASVQAVGAGTVADVWEPKERGRAMGIFFLGPLCGPGIAPVIGGGLTQGFGWRSTQWFLCIFGGVQLLLILFCLPETVHPKPPRPEAEERARTKLTVDEFLKRCFKPLEVIALLRHPAIVVAIYSGAMTFGVTFVMYVSIQSNFENSPYNFTSIEVGCLYLAPTVGYAISSVLGGRWIDYIMAREAKKAGRYNPDGKLKYLPEDRMKENMWIAAFMYPSMFIWYGWCVEKGIIWAVPMVASVCYGVFGMILYGAVTTVLTEFTPRRASSGIALNNFVRNILSCIAAVVTQPLIDAMGTGWMCTMIGLFALVTTVATLIALKTQGPKWRVTMDRKLNPQAQ